MTVELSFEAFNPEHDGVPLIILHGFFAAARNWRSLAKRWSLQRPVYALDLRNHGASPHHPQMDYPSMADDVLAFMDCQRFAQADLLGHSMGGKIAMWLALNQPQRVRQLVIADIAPVSYSHCFKHTIDSLRSLELADLLNRKQAEERLAPAIVDLSYRQFLLQNLQLQQGCYCWRINLDFFQKNAHHIVAFPDTAHLEAFERPVLFLSGEQSYYIRQEAIEAHFPAAAIIELSGTSHWLHVDAPDVFVRYTEDWLNNPGL